MASAIEVFTARSMVTMSQPSCVEAGKDGGDDLFGVRTHLGEGSGARERTREISDVVRASLSLWGRSGTSPRLKASNVGTQPHRVSTLRRPCSPPVKRSKTRAFSGRAERRRPAAAASRGWPRRFPARGAAPKKPGRPGLPWQRSRHRPVDNAMGTKAAISRQFSSDGSLEIVGPMSKTKCTPGHPSEIGNRVVAKLASDDSLETVTSMRGCLPEPARLRRAFPAAECARVFQGISGETAQHTRSS